jgi:hypothetical protein
MSRLRWAAFAAVAAGVIAGVAPSAEKPKKAPAADPAKFTGKAVHVLTKPVPGNSTVLFQEGNSAGVNLVNPQWQTVGDQTFLVGQIADGGAKDFPPRRLWLRMQNIITIEEFEDVRQMGRVYRLLPDQPVAPAAAPHGTPPPGGR